jgi:hypothetical protein
MKAKWLEDFGKFTLLTEKRSDPLSSIILVSWKTYKITDVSVTDSREHKQMILGSLKFVPQNQMWNVNVKGI